MTVDQLTLKQRLASAEPVVAPGVYDGLTALLVEQHGFDCAYLSGASISFTRLGRPDVGLTSLNDVADVVTNIRERVDISLVVDADTGFGNALNVQRTVRLLERAGASAIQLEDQTSPKRCGHLDGKALVAADEMLGKLRAALDARRSDDTLIVARTDAIAVSGLESALERGARYREAGADVVFVESPLNDEQLARVGRELGGSVPLVANMVEGGKTPLHSASELAGMGFKLVIFPGAMVRMLSRAASDYLAELRATGSTHRLLDRMNDFGAINQILGTDELLANAKRYDNE